MKRDQTQGQTSQTLLDTCISFCAYTQPRYIHCLSQTKIEYGNFWKRPEPNDGERAELSKSVRSAKRGHHTEFYSWSLLFRSLFFFLLLHLLFFDFVFCLFEHRKGSPIGRRAQCTLCFGRRSQSQCIKKRTNFMYAIKICVSLSLYTHSWWSTMCARAPQTCSNGHNNGCEWSNENVVSEIYFGKIYSIIYEF